MMGWARRSAEDRRALRAGGRRLRGARGSAYVEFAFLAPLVLMMASLLIELATFWDASVMANHAAWQVARIVKVKQDAKLFKIKTVDFEEGSIGETAASGLNKAIKLLNEVGDQRTLTTLMLMSGSSMGYTGVPGHEMGDLLTLIVSEPLKALTKDSGGLGDALGKLLDEKTSALSSLEDLKALPDGMLSGVSNALVNTVVRPVIAAVANSVLTPVVTWAQKQLNGLGEKISGALDQKGGSFSSAKHYARNLQKAYQRLFYATVGAGKKNGPVVKVYTANADGLTFLGPQGTLRQPHVAGKDPGLAGQIAYVRVRWPMASDWLFPLFWGGDRTGAGVWATGHCLTLTEPALKNANLASTDPAEYKRPEENAASAYKGVSDTIRHDLKIELFLMRYRNVRESVHLSGNTKESFLLTAHHLQDWQSIAYGGKNYPEEYQTSWTAALNNTHYSSRGALRATLNSYLNGGGGYRRREWLHYGAGKPRQRYLDTLGDLPQVRGMGVDAATQTRWDAATEAAKAHGQAGETAAGLGARLAEAGSAASGALDKVAQLRKWVDGVIAELAKRVGEEKDKGSGIELDAATLQNLSGAELTEGEEAVTPEALEQAWRQTYGELKALRDALDDLAREIGAACAALDAVSGRLAGEREALGRAIDAAGKEGAGEKAFAELGQRLAAVDASAAQAASAAATLSAKADAALAKEIEFAQKLRLNAASKLDPSKIDWGAVAAQNAQNDGVGDADLGKDGQGVYGDPDGKGDGPWKR